MREPAQNELIGGRYRLAKRLGEGGMGSVWEAMHTITRRRVALKFLRGPLGGREDVRRRFLREARAAGMVQHPNVVGVHDLFELEDETPVMVMDLLEGQTLGARLREAGQLTLREIAEYLVPAVSAVGTAHSLGIVHRDLKPENIFLVGPRDKPDVRVLDFGIAKLGGGESLSTASVSITRTGALLGTPCYMSPEQALGDRQTDHRTDIWSFGVILYEALAGARPIEGENLPQVIKRLVTDGITPIQVVVPDLPEDVAELIGSLLAQDASDRPSDLRQVSLVLERHTSVRAPPFGPPMLETSAMIPVETPDPTENVAPPMPPIGAPRRIKRRIWIAAAGIAGGAALITWMNAGRTETLSPSAHARRMPSSGVKSDVLAQAPLHSSLSSVSGETRTFSERPISAEVSSNPSPRTSGRSTPKRVSTSKLAATSTLPKSPTAVGPSAHAAEDGFVDDPPF